MKDRKQEPDPAADQPGPLTKTRLRRGEIGRKKTDPPCAEIIDFLPAVHGDVEDILCDVSGDELPPDPE